MNDTINTGRRSTRLLAFLFSVDILAVAAVFLLPRTDFFRAPATLLLMLALSALTGYRPINIRSLRTTVAASDPFVFATIAALGGLPAVLVGLISIVSTMIGARLRFDLPKMLFNLAAAALSISVASWIFELLASGSSSVLQQAFPLAVATTAYFLLNTVLVAAAISIDGPNSFFSTWLQTGMWIVVTCYSATTLAIALLFVLDLAGPAGLVLGVPPLALFIAYYRSHRDRLHEQQMRMEEILQSNQRLEEEVRARTAQLAAKVNELEHAKNRLRELAHTDDLTLLPNRRSFQQYLARELGKSKRFDHSLSVLLIDVDHFKRINDDHGHPMGDLVLQQLAAVVDQCVRATDLAARYGGEEFVVVLAETPKHGALTLARQLRQQVTESSFGAGDRACPVRLTISIGVASFPEDANDADQLISVADERLYQAKETGRDRVVA